MSRFATSIVITLTLVLLGPLAVTGQTKRPMNTEDVLLLKTPGSPKISPDGQTVVYTLTYSELRANENRTELWIAKPGSAPARFTSGRNDRAPEWSPDGTTVAFLASRPMPGAANGDPTTQIYLIPVGGGEASALTESKTSVSSFVWSPDGKRIAYIAERPRTAEEEARRKDKDDAEVVDQDFRFNELHVIDVASKRSREVVSDRMVIADMHWAPDSKRIAFTSRPTPKADDGSLSDIYIADADSPAKPRRLLDNAGPDTDPTWSPDGRSIAFLSRPTPGTLGQPKIHIVPADGGTARVVAPGFDLQANGLAFSKDGTSIFFQAGARTSSHVFSVPAAGGTPRQITTQEGVVSGFSLSGNGRMAFVRSDLHNPAEVFTATVGAADPVKLTDHNPQVRNLALGRGEVIRWKSTDGMEIEGVLIYPPDYQPGRKYPVLANIHGGPSGVWNQSFPANWSNFAHVWAGKGWVVFMPNVRGSSSYGEKFLTSNVKDWGGGDYRDIQAGLDDLVKRGIADPDRMGQTGWSYGGYMTAWTLTQTNRFKAVMVGAGLTNMYSMYSTNDLQRTLEGYFGDTPFNDPAEYAKASAMTHIKKASTPTLIMHGGNDTRVPPTQGTELYMGLRKNNVPAEMVVFPREPHGIGEPRHRMDKMNREYAWFSKHVLGKEDTFRPASDRDQILTVLNQTFEYLASRDGDKMRGLFWPEAWVVADRPNADGVRVQNFQKVDDFIRGVTAGAGQPAVLEEFVGEPEIRIDGNIASAWGKYTLTRGPDYAADGIDAFHLVRKDGQWRILSLIYTHVQRK